MANDTIDSGLYQEAVSQIASRLEREAVPVSEAVREAVAGMRRETAKDMLASAWYAARRMQADQNRHTAGRKPVEVPAPRSIAGLSPELQQLREETRRRLAATFEKNNADLHSAFDQHHEKVMCKLFTDRGISATTAERIVAEVKNKSRE